MGSYPPVMNGDMSVCNRAFIHYMLSLSLFKSFRADVTLPEYRWVLADNTTQTYDNMS